MTTVRRIELVAALSLATDLGLGSPLESGLATCLVATRFSRVLGLADDEVRLVFHLAVLRHIGCTAGNHDLAVALGSELGLHDLIETHEFRDSAEMEAALGRHARAALAVDGRRTALERPRSAVPLIVETTAGACEVASMLAGSFGFDGAVQSALLASYERWDGRGIPGRLAGDGVPLAVRTVHIAEAAVGAHQRGDDPAAWVRRRAGAVLDPDLAAKFADEADSLLAVLEAPSRWAVVVALEPGPRRGLSDEALDAALGAIGQFADLKSPYLVGHSGHVADLAGDAALAADLPRDTVAAVRRAGWIHDLGRVFVSAATWGRPGPVSRDEWERIRLHPYYTARIFAEAGSLGEAREIAALHHERLDGSGYTRGLPSALIPAGARILAAADAYAAMTEPRPHRSAIGRAAAAQELRADARAGRLDGRAVEAVLEAAGHRRRSRAEAVAGLTAREIEVLGLVARGRSNREIATELVVSMKTVDSHVQHVYAKAGVSTRAGATLFAMQHGLVRTV